MFSRNVEGNTKLLEVDMSRNNKNWLYDNQNIVLSENDSFECWFYVEVNSIGYYKSEIVQVQGKTQNLVHADDIQMTNQ
jgi:hypothetical protein